MWKTQDCKKNPILSFYYLDNRYYARQRTNYRKLQDKSSILGLHVPRDISVISLELKPRQNTNKK